MIKEKFKRIYVKPQISEVKLLPEEAVLLFCKVANSGKATKCNGPQGTCDNRNYGS